MSPEVEHSGRVQITRGYMPKEKKKISNYMVDITLVPSSVVIRETTICSQRYSIAGPKWFVGWKGGVALKVGWIYVVRPT